MKPVPGGPNNKTPLGKVRKPLKRSGLVIGQHISSVTHFLANSKPAISLNVTTCPRMQNKKVYVYICVYYLNIYSY